MRSKSRARPYYFFVCCFAGFEKCEADIAPPDAVFLDILGQLARGCRSGDDLAKSGPKRAYIRRL